MRIVCCANCENILTSEITVTSESSLEEVAILAPKLNSKPTGRGVNRSEDVASLAEQAEVLASGRGALEGQERSRRGAGEEKEKSKREARE